MGDKSPSFRSAPSRLKGGLRPEMAVCYPVPDERIARVLAGVHRFDKAHIVMLFEVGLLERSHAKAMLDALLALDDEPDGAVAARLRIGGGNHSGEQYLTDVLGERVAGHIHTGRSSSDLSAVANRITQQDAMVRLMARVVNLRETLVKLAREHASLVMMGYSHLQHAQPTTLGHYWVNWLVVLERDFERLAAVHARYDFCPAGSAILTGSRFPIDIARVAALLGFSKPFVNTRDGSWGCDGYLEAGSVVAAVMNTCARLCEDLNIWSTQEFGFVELADGFCINSSILPQKKNPIALQHIRGVAKLCASRVQALFSIFSAASDTVVFDRYLATDELWRACTDAEGAIDLLTAVLGDLTIHQAAIKRAFSGSWGWTSDLAAALVLEHGLTWRTAQQAASLLVRHMMEAGRAPETVIEQDIEAAIKEYSGLAVHLAAGFVAAVRNPEAIVASRLTPGGPAVADVARQIELMVQQMRFDIMIVEAKETQQRNADAQLADAIDAARSGAAGDPPAHSD
jgi:argininosuccinate lyase